MDAKSRDRLGKWLAIAAAVGGAFSRPPSKEASESTPPTVIEH